MDAIAHDLAQSQIVQVKTLRQPQLQVEEAVIDALDRHAHRPAVLFVARLGVTGHGQTFGLPSGSCMFIAHVGSEEDPKFAAAACAGASMSSSANCKSCSRA